MLLALDVGNTNVTVGVFEGRRLIDHRRLRTVRDQTSDEWGILLRNLFHFSQLDIAKVDGIIISSVVPPLNASLAEMAERISARIRISSRAKRTWAWRSASITLRKRARTGW